jgi:hypothetical protein
MEGQEHREVDGNCRSHVRHGAGDQSATGRTEREREHGVRGGHQPEEVEGPGL